MPHLGPETPAASLPARLCLTSYFTPYLFAHFFLPLTLQSRCCCFFEKELGPASYFSVDFSEGCALPPE